MISPQLHRCKNKMKCPRDQSLLEEVSTEGIRIFVCPTCHGVLLHQDQFERIREITKIEYPKTKRSEIEILEETAKSPVNGETMKVIEYDGIIIDICLESKYIWFDHGELEALFRKKNKKQEHGDDQSFNVFDALDALHLAEFVGEIFESVFENAPNLIDF
jgi:Zn-finger nucleic acid-binding protein